MNRRTIEGSARPCSRTQPKKVMTVGLILAALGLFGWDESDVAWAGEDLSGTYLLFQQTTTVTKLPVVKDIVARTRSVSLHQLNQKDERLFGAGQLCDLKIKSSSKLVKTSLPKSLRDLLVNVPFDATLSRGENGLALSQESPTLVLGAKLKHPDRDPLPTKAEDKRTFDQDLDGHPGVTVEVSGFVSGKVYVVQRSRSRLRGKQTDDGFRGAIAFHNEQNVIGASSPMLERDPQGQPVPEESYFVLARLPPGASCADALRATVGFR